MSLFYPAAALILTYLVMLAYRYLEEQFERRRITGIFGRYVAPQVVDQILKEGEEGLKLGGTRKEISVLFVDIRGFTPLSEKVEPEEVVGILNSYLNLTAKSIFDNEGTLDKFIGDATMAIFNAPLDLADHEFKAVKAAWAMKQGAAALQKELEEKYGKGVSFGIGVNTGYAVVGNIGATFRMDFTAIGDTVNTAARLESNAKPDQILLSSSIYEKVKDRVEATYLGEIKVKGKEQGVPVYQLDAILD
jgi:adenylate cyclase